MENQKPVRPPFTSRPSRAELLLALLWLPVHLFLLPRLAVRLFPALDDSWLNIVVYGTGTAYMLLTQFRFLRRDFDPLCDRLFYVLLEVLVSFGAMMLFNMALNSLLVAFLAQAENPNNAAVVDMALTSSGPIAALAIFLAPLVEEPIFRGAVFGGLRHRSRPAAYLLSIALFSGYHVWGYAFRDPTAWIYALQYVPVSFLLCRIYERTDSLWGSILLHMFVNFVSLNALTALEKLL